MTNEQPNEATAKLLEQIKEKTTAHACDEIEYMMKMRPELSSADLLEFMLTGLLGSNDDKRDGAERCSRILELIITGVFEIYLKDINRELLTAQMITLTKRRVERSLQRPGAELMLKILAAATIASKS